MAWQPYVDNMIATGQCCAAIIGGLDGVTWAHYGVEPKDGELLHLLEGFHNCDRLRGDGAPTIGDERFIFLRGDDECLNLRKGSGGACVHKTEKALIIGQYNENMSAGANNLQVGKIADFLREAGY